MIATLISSRRHRLFALLALATAIFLIAAINSDGEDMMACLIVYVSFAVMTFGYGLFRLPEDVIAEMARGDERLVRLQDASHAAQRKDEAAEALERIAPGK